LVEAVRLSRKIGRTASFSDLIDHEMAPGNTVDHDEALRANIVSSVAAYLHPTLTVPMGTDSIRRLSSTPGARCGGSKSCASWTHRSCPIFRRSTNVTTIMVAERSAAKLSA